MAASLSLANGMMLPIATRSPVETVFLPPPKGLRRYKLNSHFLFCTRNVGSGDKVLASATFSDLLERFPGLMEEAT